MNTDEVKSGSSADEDAVVAEIHIAAPPN